MRVGFIGVSHWHAPLYYRPAARLAGVQIVAVSDGQLPLAEQVGARLGARAFADYRDLVQRERPDFVFVFGRPSEMAATARFLIDEAVPFMIEKPGGLDFGQVAELPALARSKALHAGTGFTYRASPLWGQLAELIGDDEVTHASFRYVGGGPYRYHEVGCPWMLDPAQGGGGPLMNFGVHLVDLYRGLCRREPEQVGASLSHDTWGLAIEDYAVAILRGPGSVCTLETGYTYPAELSVFDTRFSLRTRRLYLTVGPDDALEITRAYDGGRERLETRAAHAPYYAKFTADTLERFARGQPPLASLEDLAGTLRVIEAAYRSGRAGGAPVSLASVGPPASDRP